MHLLVGADEGIGGTRRWGNFIFLLFCIKTRVKMIHPPLPLALPWVSARYKTYVYQTCTTFGVSHVEILYKNGKVWMYVVTIF